MIKLRLWCDTDNSPFPTSMFLALTLFITSSEDGGSSSPGGSCFCGYSLFCVLSSWCQRTLRSCCLPSTLLLSIFSGLQTEPSHSQGVVLLWLSFSLTFTTILMITVLICWTVILVSLCSPISVSARHTSSWHMSESSHPWIEYRHFVTSLRRWCEWGMCKSFGKEKRWENN